MMSNIKTTQKTLSLLLISFGLLYILLILYFAFVLNFDFMQGDVLGYWQDSLQWRIPFHSYHVPGYPLMVALIRGVTFGILSPTVLMWSINLMTYLVSIILVYWILILSQFPERTSLLAATLFGLWPLVGLTYTVFPIADLPVICFFLFGLYFNLRDKPLLSGLFMGLALVTHKAIWIFVLLFFIFDCIRRRNFFSKRTFISLSLTVLPLAILWIFGWSYHQDPFWLVSNNLETEIASRNHFPLLDGLLGTLVQGGVIGVAKFLLLFSFMIINGFSLYLCIKFRTPFWQQALSISVGCLMLFIVLNQYEIWAAVRFSRLLVIPLAIVLTSNAEKFLEKQTGKILSILTVFILFISQFAYAWFVDYYHS